MASRNSLVKGDNSFSKYVAIVYFMATIVLYTLPAVKILAPYVFVGLFMLLFLPIAMMKGSKEFNYVLLLLITTLIAFYLNVLLGIYSLTEAINEAIRNIRFFLPVLWSMYVIKFCPPKHKKIILAFFFVLTTVILINTMIALREDPWIARILAQDKLADTAAVRAYRMRNVGGFEFAYMMGIITLCFTWLAINVKKPLVRVLSIIVVATNFYYIIQTMYTTLLILTFVGIVLLFVFYVKTPSLKAILLLLCVVGVLLSAPICLELSSLFGDSLLSKKFFQIYQALSGEGYEVLGTRPELLLDAFKKFLLSPIWGGNKASVSAHSFILTLLANNGLIGIITFASVFLQSRKLIVSELKARGNSTLLCDIAFVYIFVLAIMNPIGYVFEVCIAGFFIVPLFIVTTSELSFHRRLL